jgi:phosphonate degradation associated HDIG domain protein
MSTVAVEEVMALFERKGNSQYGREAVSQLEHALQAAALAEADGAGPALITAALLHDVGHLLHDLPPDAPEDGVDDHHEKSSSNFLRQSFPPAVTEPIRLHVAAKRYLCTVEPDYFARLSDPSVVSLNLQGGRMSQAEIVSFEAETYFADSVRLRRWDDEAKVPDLATPSLTHFAGYLTELATSGAAG